jgi:hypothetical protein
LWYGFVQSSIPNDGAAVTDHLTKAEDAPSRLEELGLTAATLGQAVQLGLAAAATCTKHDPSNLPGLMQWGRTIRGLRDTLVPQGWKSQSTYNYPTVVSPDRSVAVSVAGGDYFTGRSDGVPSTRSSKGPVTRAAVIQNQLTFAELDPSFADLNPAPTTTWLLLHHYDQEAKEVRVELSLPAGLDADDVVTAWHERILLEPLTTAYEPPDTSEEVDIDIPLTRR